MEDADPDVLEEVTENLLGESNIQDVSVSDIPRMLLESGPYVGSLFVSWKFLTVQISGISSQQKCKSDNNNELRSYQFSQNECSVFSKTCCSRMFTTMVPRLRGLAPTVRGSQAAGSRNLEHLFFTIPVICRRREDPAKISEGRDNRPLQPPPRHRGAPVRFLQRGHRAALLQAGTLFSDVRRFTT